MTEQTLKPELLERLACPQCWSRLTLQNQATLQCSTYGHAYALQDGIPTFTPVPAGMIPSKKIERGPDKGTPWRRVNWAFLEQQVSRLDPQAVVLDVGAGRGDFASLLKNHRTVALDVFPYPEVDIVCDLTQVNPFRAESFDAVILMNVLEHIYDTHALLSSLAGLLKWGGVLIVAIPFMVKMHQVPVDFVRYTHFALQRLGEDHGLFCEQLEGYYDPVFFLREGIGTIRWSALPALRGWKRYLARGLVEGIHTLADLLETSLGRGRLLPPSAVKNWAPTGYRVVYRKDLPQTMTGGKDFAGRREEGTRI